MEKKFEMYCEDAVKALRNFQEVSLSKLGGNNMDLSQISKEDSINLYAALEQTKQNILKLREMIS